VAVVERLRIVVSGRVQGVWFRESCRREAAAAGVGGWVGNHADGTVHAALEGERAAVARVLAWMRVGPPGADVTGVVVTSEAPLGDHRFVVR
jgi:acylphosphatase